MIITLDISKKDVLPILILEIRISSFANKQINMGIIVVDTYYMTYRLKRAQVFVISMRDLKYQVEKKLD